MTHKEEAINRVNEFKPFTDSISVINYSTDNKWHLRNCKQCALLAIKREILLLDDIYAEVFGDAISEVLQVISTTIDRLTKVKQEIEQL